MCSFISEHNSRKLNLNQANNSTQKPHSQLVNVSPLKLSHDHATSHSKAVSPSSTIKDVQASRHDSDESTESPLTSNVSFFNPNKNQTTYYLLEHGEIYIYAIPYLKKFLLNSVTLGYKLILLTNNQGVVTEIDNASPEHYFMILGNPLYL